MKKKKATSRVKKAAPTTKPKTKLAAKSAQTHKPPVSIRSARGGGDSDRGLYVRFAEASIKDQVKAAAEAQNASMNAYIVAATIDWVKEKRSMPEVATSAAS